MEKIIKLGLKDFSQYIIYNPAKLIQLVNENGDFFTLKVLGSKIHIISTPQPIKHVLLDHSKKYTQSHGVFKGITKLIGPYGFNSSTEWEIYRKTLGSIFNKDKLDELTTLSVKTIAKQLDLINTHAKNGSPLDLDPYIRTMMLRITLAWFLDGTKVDFHKVIQLNNTLFSLLPTFFGQKKYFGIIPQPTYFIFTKLTKSYRALANIVIKQSFSDNIKEENNAIKLLAKVFNYPSFDKLDAKMIDHLRVPPITYFLTAEGLSMTLIRVCTFLSLYPMIRNKLYEEVKTILGSREPTYKDLAKFSYATAIVKETLRLQYPGAPIQYHDCIENDIIENHPVNKGDIIGIPVYETHRDPRYWENPEAFDPNRFLSPLNNDQKLLYLPFSLGDRSCLGSQFAVMHITLFIIMLAQRYYFELIPGCSLERAVGIVNRFNENIMVNVCKIPNE